MFSQSDNSKNNRNRRIKRSSDEQTALFPFSSPRVPFPRGNYFLLFLSWALNVVAVSNKAHSIVVLQRISF